MDGPAELLPGGSATIWISGSDKFGRSGATLCITLYHATDFGALRPFKQITYGDPKGSVLARVQQWLALVGLVTSLEIRERSANDAPLFRPLVESTKKTFKVNEVSADTAYSSVENIEAVFVCWLSGNRNFVWTALMRGKGRHPVKKSRHRAAKV
jgi:hypothetical protein